MRAHAIFLTDQAQSLSSWTKALETGPVLGPYRTFGTGVGEDDEGLFMTIVLVYESVEEASSDVAVFEQRIETSTKLWSGQPWRDLVTSSEIWADGRSLRDKLHGGITRVWL